MFAASGLCCHSIVLVLADWVCLCICKPCEADALPQASISAANGQWDVKKAKLKGVRKITPSQPQGASPRVKTKIPSNVAAAAAAGRDMDANKGNDAVKLRLQQVFLEQYSPSDAKARFLAFKLE